MTGVAITAHLDDLQLKFRSKLLLVDPNRNYIVVACSDNAASNAALLAQPVATFSADVDEWRIEFVASSPKPDIFAGSQAIELAFPVSIVSQRRRMHDRAPVPARAGLKCTVYNQGIAIFEGSITDISHGGVGLMHYDPKVKLDPGMIIKNCNIERPGRETVIVDLEVRFTESLVLPVIGQAQRTGCRFASRSPATLALIEEFVNSATGTRSTG